MIQWIKCSDRLPKEGESVLCFPQSGGRIVENSWEQYCDQDAVWFKNRVSYWMPLPTPPTAEPLPTTGIEEQENEKWKLKGHSHQIADTGDYDGYYEITDGNVSILTTDDDEEALQPIVDALNNSGCKFYQDDYLEFENHSLKLQNEELISELRQQSSQPKPQEQEVEEQEEIRQLKARLIHFSTLDKMPTLSLLDREGLIDHVVEIAKAIIEKEPPKNI